MVSVVLDRGTVVKFRYVLLGYRGLTGQENKTATIIIDITKAFDLVQHDRLLRKLAATGVDLRVLYG